MNLAEAVQAEFDEVRVPIQAAMAGRFKELVMENFGENGTSRPHEWEDLRSKKYARKVGRDYATLYVDGSLMDSVQIDPYNPDAAAVFSDSEYASTHQWGDESRNIAPRPFFPMTEAGLTPYAIEEVTKAAQWEAVKQLGAA